MVVFLAHPLFELLLKILMMMTVSFLVSLCSSSCCFTLFSFSFSFLFLFSSTSTMSLLRHSSIVSSFLGTTLVGLLNDTETSPVEGLRSFLYLADQNITGVIGAASSSVSRFVYKKRKGGDNFFFLPSLFLSELLLLLAPFSKHLKFLTLLPLPSCLKWRLILTFLVLSPLTLSRFFFFFFSKLQTCLNYHKLIGC